MRKHQTHLYVLQNSRIHSLSECLTSARPHITFIRGQLEFGRHQFPESQRWCLFLLFHALSRTFLSLRLMSLAEMTLYRCTAFRRAMRDAATAPAYVPPQQESRNPGPWERTTSRFSTRAMMTTTTRNVASIASIMGQSLR